MSAKPERTGSPRAAIAYSTEELAEIDRAAQLDGSSRSAWIRETTLMRARGRLTIIATKREKEGV